MTTLRVETFGKDKKKNDRTVFLNAPKSQMVYQTKDRLDTAKKSLLC